MEDICLTSKDWCTIIEILKIALTRELSNVEKQITHDILLRWENLKKTKGEPLDP